MSTNDGSNQGSASTVAPSLEERLREFEDEREIVRTLNQYAVALDYDLEPSRFADCFTESGVWWSSAEGRWAGTVGLRLDGRKGIEQWFVDRTTARGTTGMRTKHMFRTPIITLKGDTASSDTHFFVLHESPSGPIIHAMGRYLDSWVRCADGRWRIEDRHLARDVVQQSHQEKVIG